MKVYCISIRHVTLHMRIMAIYKFFFCSVTIVAKCEIVRFTIYVFSCMCMRVCVFFIRKIYIKLSVIYQWI